VCSDLLLECGIGMEKKLTTSEEITSSNVVSQHRVLIFCQFKSMLDIIEEDLFQKHMANVSYLRLDGNLTLLQFLIWENSGLDWTNYDE
jgi:TATA-binding protein-associated factor